MALLPSFFLVQLALAPLPPHLMLALDEIEVETSIETAGMFRLHFALSRTAFGDLDALVADLFRPLFPVRVSLSFGLGLPLTLINGYIRDAQLSVGDTPGTARLEVTGADALATIMGHVQAPMPWPNAPDGVIAAGIFGRYGIAPAVTPTPPTRTIVDTTTVQRSRDNAFLRQLAAFHGYHAYLQPDPLAGVDVGHFKPLSAMLAFPPQGVLSTDFGTQTNLHGFRVTNRMLQPTTVAGAFVDADTRAPVPVVAAAAAEVPMGLEPSLVRVIPPPVAIDDAGRPANVAEKYIRAFAQVTRDARTVTATGEVDGLKFARPLLPGLPVAVRGAGREHSGLYLVKSVTHRITREAYTQSFSALRNAVTMTGLEPFVDPLAAVA